MRASRCLPLALLVLALPHCTCGKDSQKEAPEDIRALFERLFKSLPAAKVAQPIEAIPDNVSLVMSSPDPEAWRAWAVAQPFAKSMMETPLFDDVRLSRPWLAFEGLRQNIARVSAFVGKKEDLGAIWRGPTAAAYVFGEGDAKDSLLLVKRIDPSVRELVRFGAAFALAAKPEQGSSELRVRKEETLEVYTLERRGESVSFAVFRDLLVAGTNEDLVTRSALLAMGEARKGDRPASKGAYKDVLPPVETAGVHFGFVAPEQEMAKLAGLSGIGLSLVADAAKPILIRRTGGEDPGSDALSLLRYAPSSTFLAIADGQKASDALLEAGRVPEELRDRLAPGIAVLFDKGAVLALRHKGTKEELEAPLREMLKEMSGKDVERVVLEDGALLLKSANDGASAALTNDAVLFAFAPDRLRDALSAGAGKAPSLADRQGLDIKAAAGGGVYFDLAKSSAFLATFYQRTLGSADASTVLQPTFDALAGGGAYFSRLEQKDDVAEGAFHALP
jgi:hypothetical protein